MTFAEGDMKNKRRVGMDPICLDESKTTEFLNRPEVKRALHVDDITWETCNFAVALTYDRWGGSLYLYPELIKSGLRILLFNGDTDLSVCYIGNMNWINDLKMEIVSPWRSWRHPDDPYNVAGFRQIYDGLTFVTFKGTGHMAVQWKAKEAFYMLDQYFKGKDL